MSDVAPISTVPNKAVRLIMERIDNPKDLLAFAFTCKTYRSMLPYVKVKGTVRCMNANMLPKVSTLLPHTMILDVADAALSTVRNSAVTTTSSFAGFRSLVALKIRRHSIYDLDVAVLSCLVNLKILDLSGHTSHLTLHDLSGLSSLVALEDLDLSGNWVVSDVSCLSSLVALRTLNLAETRVSDVSCLASLVALQTLNLYETEISDISCLLSLVALRELNIGTDVSDVSCLSSLVSLRTLDLAECPVRDVSCLSSLVALQTLDISDTRIKNVSCLSSLTALRTLNIFALTKVRDVSCLHQPNLEILGR